jgi:hypothetical protein
VRRGWFTAGVILLVVGLILFVAGLLLSATNATQTVSAGSAWVISPTTLTPVTASVNWSGATASTHVYLSTGTPRCSGAQGIVAGGAGTHGSFTTTLSPGTKYYLFACSGTSFQTATLGLRLSGGINAPIALGLAAAPIGLLLALLGRKGSRYERPVRQQDLTSIFDEPRTSSRPISPPPASTPTATAVGQRPPPAVPFGGRTLRGCPGCGKVWPVGQYATCPACGHTL